MHENKQIFFLGDELITGVGDTRALGWIGRVLARTESATPIIPISLATAGESLGRLALRWEREVLPRVSAKSDNRLVVALGTHDLDEGTSIVRSRLYLANLLDTAQRHGLKTLVVGPPPRNDIAPNILQDLSKAYEDVCARRGTPFVETFTPLVKHDQWNTDLAVSGGYTPHQAGYGLIAWLVLHQGWQEWINKN